MPKGTPPPLDEFGPFDTTSSEGSCVEVARGPEGWKAVRDSNTPAGPVLFFDAKEWSVFTDAVKTGHHD